MLLCGANKIKINITKPNPTLPIPKAGCPPAICEQLTNTNASHQYKFSDDWAIPMIQAPYFLIQLLQYGHFRRL